MLKLSNFNIDKVYKQQVILSNTILFENIVYDIPKYGYYYKDFPICSNTENIIFVNCNSYFIRYVISKDTLFNLKKIYLDNVIRQKEESRIVFNPNDYLKCSDEVYLDFTTEYDEIQLFSTERTNVEVSGYYCDTYKHNIIDENKLTNIINVIELFSSNIE